jgi:hypothetical protein
MRPVFRPPLDGFPAISPSVPIMAAIPIAVIIPERYSADIDSNRNILGHGRRAG